MTVRKMLMEFGKKRDPYIGGKSLWPSVIRNIEKR